MLQSQYSSDWYDAIWKPYRRYIEDFIKKNPKGLHSFLKLSKLLNYHEGLLHIKELRSVDFETVDCEQLEKLFVNQSRYVSRFFGGQRYFVPETGSRTHWMGFVLANAITGHFDNAKTYIELGAGIGGMLFDIHGFTLNNKNIYYGVDYSEDGVEGGDAVFSLLSSEEYSPFWKFMQSDILDLPAGVFDASGQDTVVLTVSVLNKIPELPTDFFVKIRNLVCHARRIDRRFSSMFRSSQEGR